MLSLTGFCIVIGLTGGFVIKQMRADSVDARSTGQPAVRRAATETVPVALSDILPGTKIEAAYLTEAPILSTKVRKHPDTVRSANALIGRIAKQKISVATPLRLSMFYPVDRKPDIRIPPGQRLVSVQVADQSGFLSGLIQSGSYVDVFTTIESTATGDGAKVVQLFEGVRVYEVFSSNGVTSSSVGIGGHSEAVLELDPEQQKVMLLAKERGRISLTYNPEGPGNAGLADDALASESILRGDIFTQESILPEQVQSQQLPADQSTIFVTEQFRNGIRSHATYDAAGVKISQPTNPTPQQQQAGPSADRHAQQPVESHPISWRRGL